MALKFACIYNYCLLWQNMTLSKKKSYNFSEIKSDVLWSYDHQDISK